MPEFASGEAGGRRLSEKAAFVSARLGREQGGERRRELGRLRRELVEPRLSCLGGEFQGAIEQGPEFGPLVGINV